MKRIVFSLLSLTLALTAFAPLAQASTPNAKYGLNSFNVTNLAYQGRFSEAGVPGYGALVAGVNTGSITAESVIQAAVDAGRLSESALQDDGFIRSVSRGLQTLIDSN